MEMGLKYHRLNLIRILVNQEDSGIILKKRINNQPSIVDFNLKITCDLHLSFLEGFQIFLNYYLFNF